MRYLKYILLFLFFTYNLQAQTTVNDTIIELNSKKKMKKYMKQLMKSTESIVKAQPDSTWNGVLASSDLPIIILNTNNVTIPDTPKIAAKMGVIYNGEGVRNYVTNSYNNYNNNIGIELRGSTSLSFPQKSYSVETRDINGNEHDTAVLGMPSENAWILYAPYNDKSCMRNVLTYNLANKLGHYAVKTKYCEVVLNGQYQGIYVWMEKIKRDSNRVNISKLKDIDTTGDQLTGGYIIKIDKPNGSGGSDGWNSTYLSSINKTIHFLYDYPENVDIKTQQKNYIKAYVDSFEVALKASNYADPVNGYRKYMDVNSFIDYLIINEISKNVDAYRLSTFLYKDRYTHGGKLYIGPVWDYNIAWWNANYCGGNQYTGWAYNFNSVCSDTYTVPFWWARLLQDTTFKNSLKCRYTSLRQTVLSTAAIHAFIDSTVNMINEAQARHFVKWPILGVYTWPNPTPYATTYAGEITALKNWIQNRMNWLDANMPGNLILPSVNLGSDTSACPGQLVLNAGNNGCTYLWNTGAISQTLTVNTAGNYSVTVNNNGCKKSDTIAVTLKPLPNAFAGNDTAVCQGNSIALNATGGVSYVWNNNILQGVPFIPLFSQYYTVTVTGSNGCIAKDSLNIDIVINPPKPSISVIYSTYDTLISSSNYGNQWFKNGVKLTGQTASKLVVPSSANGMFSVIVTENGCSSDTSDAIAIYTGINDYSGNFQFNFYPNPFNEEITLHYSLKNKDCIKISIFDATGREIRNFNNIINDAGNYNIKLDVSDLNSGVYFYNITVGDEKFSGKVIKTPY